MTIASVGRLLASTLLAGSALATASPLFAQDTGPKASPSPTSPTGESADVVVTGSRIRDSSLSSASPVQVTRQDEIQLRQSNTAEDLLRELPGVVPSIGSAVNNGNSGFAFADLRGLGANRNLILLDGQRIVPADVIGRVDLNNIPLALIQRVETLTGGASTTYGADAISGVVNFITRSDFTGVDIQASNQITQKGDGRYSRIDATVGSNFAGGRGNAVLSLGYQNADPVTQGERGFSVQNIDSFSGQPFGSSFANPAVFDLLGATPGRFQVRPASGALSEGVYQSFNYNPYNLFQVPFKRYNAYAAGRYRITDNVEAYVRGLYSRNETTTVVAPSAIGGSTVTIPLSNPYLPAGIRTAFCADAGYTAAQCVAAAGATSPTDPLYRTVTESLRFRSVDAGSRVDQFVTQVYDIRGGLRGDISDHVKFDVAGSYGESTNNHAEYGYLSLTRFRDALLATNTSTCLSGNSGCVPINIFGSAGSTTPAMNNYVVLPAFSNARSSLAQASADISGDIGRSSPFATKPVSFALGGDYRKYNASQDGDIAKTTPGELGLDLALTPFSGGYDVLEGYGELIAPLVQDKALLTELTLETGVRYSHYRVDAAGSPTFNTVTYKAGGDWTPVEGLKFRGVYQHAVRAPNINELFQPASTGFVNLASDPCAGAAPLTSANLAATCRAQGAPVTSIGQISPPGTQVNSTASGNLGLKPEKSDSFTLGLVVQPRRLVPGFSLTIDYFHIKVHGAITSLTALDAVNACFGTITAASATNPACTAIRRNPATGGLDGDFGTTPGLYLPLTNQGTLLTDGIDLGAAYRHDIGPGSLNLSFNGTWTSRNKFRATPNGLNRECVAYYSTSCGSPGAPDTGSLQPRYVWNQRTTYSLKAVDLSVLWRHVGAVRQEPDDAINGDGPVLPGFDRIKAFNYFDGSVRFNVNKTFAFTVSVENMLDRKPPIVGFDVGTTSFNSGNTYPSTYDALGRRFAVSARVRL